VVKFRSIFMVNSPLVIRAACAASFPFNGENPPHFPADFRWTRHKVFPVAALQQCRPIEEALRLLVPLGCPFLAPSLPLYVVDFRSASTT
jgi:hypothetical protein